MEIQFTCLYCDHVWGKHMYNKATIENEICPICKDKNLKVVDLAVSKVDYYAGTKPFKEEKDDDDKDKNWNF